MNFFFTPAVANFKQSFLWQQQQHKVSQQRTKMVLKIF